MSIQKRDNGVRWRHVDVVRLDTRTVDRFRHRHRGPTAQDAAQHALAITGQVQNHYERHATVARHVIEEIVESVDAACGGAYADNRKFVGIHGACRTLKLNGIASPAFGFVLKHENRGLFCRTLAASTGHKRLKAA